MGYSSLPTQTDDEFTRDMEELYALAAQVLDALHDMGGSDIADFYLLHGG